MVTIYFALPLLLVVALLQATVMPHLVLWGVFPNLPLVIVASWGLLRGSGQGLTWGLVAGVALDLFSGAPFGTSILTLIAIGALSGQAKRIPLHTDVTLSLITVFAASILYGLLFLLLLQVQGQTVLWWDTLIRIIIPAAALNVILTPVVFPLLRWVYNRYFSQEMEW